MKAITYNIELKEPLLATALQGDPNSSLSLPYIPGSMVRGLVIGRYLKENTNVPDITSDPNCQRLFFNGKTRYLHAYPYDPAIRKRCLPTPRSLRRFKNKQVTESDVPIFDASHQDWDCDEQREQEREDALKSVAQSFCHIAGDGDTIIFYEPERTLTIHTQRDARKGRSHKQEGEIFRYEALAAGQWFQGVILVDDEQDVADIQRLLHECATCWIGRSRSAGYGRAALSNVQIHTTWRETGGTAPSIQTGDFCTMTLLSDTLLFDNNGQPVTSFDNTMMSTLLGFPVHIDETHTHTSSVLHGGFNRTWKLPILQHYMLAAGSVIACTIQSTLDANIISQIEAQGIGARRAEGFGRVVFGRHDAMKMTSHDTLRESPSPDTSLSPMEQHMAQRMARRLLEADIDRAILGYVKDIRRIDNAPGTSQLNRMRTLARQQRARGSVGIETVLNDFNQFKQAAGQQFERARIVRGGTTEQLDTWITKLLAKPQNIKRLLNIKPYTVADVEAPIDDNLAASTAVRLLATVMEHAVRLSQQQGKQEGSTKHERPE